MPIQVNGATSGSATLQATDAQTVTLTLPATSGTLSVSGGSPSFATLTVTGDASISGLTVGKGGGADTSGTALGVSALASNNAVGNQNTAVGYQAMTATTSGYNTAAVGYKSLFTNTTGNTNASLGAFSLYLNTSGSSNTSVGYQSLFNNTTASNNTAVGYQAGYSNTTGIRNTLIGQGAGYTTTTANHNTFVGYNAGYSSNVSADAFNTCIGYTSGSDLTSGTKNSILGRYTGNQSGLDIRTASNYIVLSDGDGNPALYSSDTTNANWVLNAKTGAAYSGLLSFATNGTINSQIWYNNSQARVIVQNSTAGVYLASGGTSWTSNSDERKKDIIEPIIDAANKVSTLRAVIGKYKKDKEGTRRPFLIAQDVQAVFPEAVDSQNPDDLGVAYGDMVPLLVAAIKEQQAQLVAQATVITQLQADVAALKGTK